MNRIIPTVIPGPWPVVDRTGATLMSITAIATTPADGAHCESGLLVFVRLEIDGLLELDGLTLRRIRGGRMSLSFPSRTARSGSRHPVVRPRDREARAAIERTVLEALGFDVEAATAGGR